MIAGLVWIAASSAWALGPHEVLVLVNGRSATSVEVGEAFVRLRGVPAENVVRLDLPTSLTTASGPVSPELFTKHVWMPAVRTVRERGLSERVLAWVYSTEFPTAVKTEPVMSLMGITFLRNRTVSPEKVAKGRYRSPFYGGPNHPGDRVPVSQTLDVFREWVGPSMPIPSMMLGYTGVRGSSKQTVLRTLKRGKDADGTHPKGTVYLVEQEQIRSRPRDWQFRRVRNELSVWGVNCVITNAFPEGCKDVMGIQMGAAEVTMSEDTVLLPGSMADHLTSLAGAFETSAQTKLTAWLAAGASSSSGTVVEPLSIWTKFPAARFYVHYASGCTMLESYYQSIRCPLQILLVGDPLAAPWATSPTVRVTVPRTVVQGEAMLVRVAVEGEGHYADIRLWLDGERLDGKGGMRSIRTEGLAAGAHVLRAVAYRTGFLRIQGFAEQRFHVTHKPSP